jgi:hypothetical protein
VECFDKNGKQLGKDESSQIMAFSFRAAANNLIKSNEEET